MATASSALMDGLAADGKLLVVGASFDPVTVSAGDLIGRGIQVLGSLTGSAVEIDENSAFAARQGVRAMVEQDDLDHAPAAFARMRDGKAGS